MSLGDVSSDTDRDTYETYMSPFYTASQREYLNRFIPAGSLAFSL
jgi:hypothetical protein